MDPSSGAGAAPAAQPVTPHNRFVARQPILTGDEKVFGYELLFRDGIVDYFQCADPEAASRNTLDTSVLMGIDLLCDGRRAFINCTREMLMQDYMRLLPPHQAVIEVLESVEPDEEVRDACRRMKDAGYLIALDDFALNDPRECMTDLADIIKVDIRATPLSECAAMVKKYGPWKSRLLAEKVETREEFKAAREAGFVYFQGYFFRHPELMKARDIPANRINYLRLLKSISQPELDSRAIEDLIKSEASLCYRLLRYLNSAIFGFAYEITSVRHALAVLGENEVRRWVRLVATLGAGQGRPSDIVLCALVRARFCELLAPSVSHGESDLFLLGLFSLMDSIMQLPMAQVLENIPIDLEIKSVLMGGASQLEVAYQLMLAQESRDWTRREELARQIHLSGEDLSRHHWAAMQWAKAVYSAI